MLARVLFGAILLLAAGVAASPAKAALMRIDVVGSVTFASDAPPGVAVGNVVQASFTFEVDPFEAPIPAPAGLYWGPVTHTLTAGTFQRGGSAWGPATISVMDGMWGIVQISGGYSVVPFGQLRLLLQFDGSVLSSITLSELIEVNGAPLDSAFAKLEYSEGGNLLFRASIDGVSVRYVDVPVPGLAGLAVFAVAGMGLARRRRTR